MFSFARPLSLTQLRRTEWVRKATRVSFFFFSIKHFIQFLSLNIYLFIFGCIGSQSQHAGFSLVVA